MLALALGPPAPAARAAAPARPVRATGPSAPAVRRHPVTVTLITGDRVTVTAPGAAAVRPGAGREDLQFLVSRERGHLTVMPPDALPLLRSGRVDRRLFDVTGLIEAGYDDARRDNLPLLVAYRPGRPGAARPRCPAPG